MLQLIELGPESEKIRNVIWVNYRFGSFIKSILKSFLGFRVRENSFILSHAYGIVRDIDRVIFTLSFLNGAKFRQTCEQTKSRLKLMVGNDAVRGLHDNQ